MLEGRKRRRALGASGSSRSAAAPPASTGSGEPEEIGEDGKPKRRKRQPVEWVRAPKEHQVRLPVPQGGRGPAVIVPESAAEQISGGGLSLESHARLFDYELPDGSRE